MPGTTPTVETVRWRAESPRSSCRRSSAAQHGIDVGERLAHAHEHDVRDALPAWRAARARPARRSRRSRGGARSRPDRSRRTCSPSRSRPATRRTRSRGRRCASARSRPARRRACATATCVVAPSALVWLVTGVERERERVGELGAQRLRERGEVVERRALRPQAVVELRDAVLRRARRVERARRARRASRRSGWSCGARPRARTRGRCGAPRSRATGTARARRCCRPRRTACPSSRPRSCTACRPATASARPSPVPCARGSTPIT